MTDRQIEEPLTVRVRVQRNVLGLHPGDEIELPATAMVDALVRSGMLLWLDDPGQRRPGPDEGER